MGTANGDKGEYARQGVVDGLLIKHYHIGDEKLALVEMKDIIPSMEHQIFVGADGCKVGWLTVGLTGENKWKVQVFPDVSSLWSQCGDARLILIDVPIGLRNSDSSERRCDREARKLLGRPRGSSVFPVPCRDAVYADTAMASDINERLTGRKLSRQALGIIHKIREVDQLLTVDKNAGSLIKEVHPELCFWALNGGRPMRYRKKDKRGLLERRQVLRGVCPFADNLVSLALERNRGKATEDDILDAFVAAVTASKSVYGLSFVPDPPEIDSVGLLMQMAYYVLPSPFPFPKS